MFEHLIYLNIHSRELIPCVRIPVVSRKRFAFKIFAPPIPSIIQAGKMNFDFGITDIFHLHRFPDMTDQTIKAPPVMSAIECDSFFCGLLIPINPFHPIIFNPILHANRIRR